MQKKKTGVSGRSPFYVIYNWLFENVLLSQLMDIRFYWILNLFLLHKTVHIFCMKTWHKFQIWR